MARFALALIVFCAACGGNPAGPTGPIRTETATITSIRIVPDTTALKVGATEQLTAIFFGRTDVRTLEVMP